MIGLSGWRLGATYQVPLTGRHTAQSALPSPSKSAAIGMSPRRPHCFKVVAPVLLKLMYQTAFEGRQTAKSALPSPSKSATTGTSLGKPHCFMIGLSGWLLGAIYQTPFDGRHTA